MSKNCIKIGKWNSTYKYLFLAILFSLLKDFALGSDNVVTFEYLKFFDSENISNCFLVRQSFCFLFTIIMAFIFYKIESKYIGESSNQLPIRKLDTINTVSRNTTGEIELIHTEVEMITYSNYKLLIIIFLWILEEQLINYFKEIFLQLDFWMLELIIIHYFMVKILKMNVYDHQRLMLWFCILPLILKLTTILLSFLDDNNENNGNNNYQYSDVNKLKLIYIACKYLLIPALPLYFILITFRSYVHTKIKWLIDLKYISTSKILTIYGIIGFAFCFLICLISTFIPCNTSDNEGNYTIHDYFCRVKYDNKKYFDNFLAYFSGLNERDENAINEIIALILGAICFFLYKFFCLRIIEFLTPVHIIFSFPIFYIFNKTYLLFLNYFKSSGEFCYITKMKYAQIKISLDFSSDFVSIIGYLIYLEIIELNFCKFDYNIRRNILDRCELDVVKNDLNSSIKTESDTDEKLSALSSEEQQKSLIESSYDENLIK